MQPHLQAVPLGLQVNLPLIISGLFWVVTYIIVIREGFRQETYCIPAFAMCLNITWELFFAFDCPMIPACTVETAATCLCPKITGFSRVILWGWVGLDCLVIYQLMRFGKKRQPVPEIRQYFYPVIASMVVLTFFLHYTFITFYSDRAGVEDAFIINLVMSVSFIYMLMSRPELRGLPISVAWTKMFGTTLASIGFLLLKPSPFGDHDTYAFMYLLFGSNFLFDIAYIHLLTTRHKQLKQQHSATPVAVTG